MENLNTIVTITCSRDFEAMKRQARSIDLFITERCTHFVVIEDFNISIDTWRLALQPFYKNHELVLLVADDFNLNLKELREINGWLVQQLLKFYIVSKINNECYLILDSKNFFIKPISLNCWPVVEGNGMSNAILPDHKWYDFIKYASDIFNMPIPNIFWPAHTPFVFRTSVVKELINTCQLDDMFFKFKGGYEKVSEFSIYCFFSSAPLNVLEFYKTFWPENVFPTIKELSQLHTNPAILMLGLHSGLDKQCPLEFQELTQFIEDTIFKPVIMQQAITFRGIQKLNYNMLNRIAVVLKGPQRTWSITKGSIINFFDSIAIHVDYYWVMYDKDFDNTVLQLFKDLKEKSIILKTIPVDENYNNQNCISEYQRKNIINDIILKESVYGEYEYIFETRPDMFLFSPNPKLFLENWLPDTNEITVTVLRLMSGADHTESRMGVCDLFYITKSDTYKKLCSLIYTDFQDCLERRLWPEHSVFEKLCLSNILIKSMCSGDVSKHADAFIYNIVRPTVTDYLPQGCRDLLKCFPYIKSNMDKTTHDWHMLTYEYKIEYLLKNNFKTTDYFQ